MDELIGRRKDIAVIALWIAVYAVCAMFAPEGVSLGVAIGMLITGITEK